MHFTKMQGLGNDYIYLDCQENLPPDVPALARKLSDRHFGIGSDGLICILPSTCADFQMRMWNADGSEGAMCGNGIRCVGKFLFDKGITARTDLNIETRSGIKTLRLHLDGATVSSVTVDMGKPVVLEARSFFVEGRTYRAFPVNMGNPHLVTFVSELDSLELEKIGPLLERHAAFPDGVNVEFVTVIDPSHLAMRVWERGSGETLACGTGACAALAAGVSSGQTGQKAEIRLRGGTLSVALDSEGHIFLTGPAVTVFEGEWPDP